MSDIRFNQWLHQSGTGGVSQSDGGHVGIGTTNPLLPVGAGNTHILHVGVVTSNSISAGSSITATTFYGSGANLTSLPSQLTLSNNADNRVITGGSGTNLNGEANLTFDGNDLTVTGTAPAINFIDTDADDYKIHNVQGVLKITDTTASADRFVINDNGTGYFLSNFQIGSTTSSPGATLHINTSYPSLKVDSGGHASDAYVRIISGNAQNSRVDFGDSDDDNIGIIDYDHANNSMSFTTNTTERLRIASNGQVSISSDGTTDGLLTIKGDTDQVGTPSIRLLDGSDTREVSITNTSGDFVVSVHGNDNAIHGHIKMFESGIIDFNNGGASGSNTNRLRIASDGNFGFNTSSPSAYALATFNSANGIQLQGDSQSRILMRNNTGGTNEKMMDIQCNGNINFRTINDDYTTATTRATFRTDGNFVVGNRVGTSSPSTNQPVAFHSARITPDTMTSTVSNGVRCNLYVGSNGGWAAGDGGVIGMGGSRAGYAGQEAIWAYIKGSRSSGNGWEYAGKMELGTTEWGTYNMTKAVTLHADNQIDHHGKDNTMYSASIGGAVRVRLQHTGGGNMTLSNPSSGSFTFDTSSDYRLKENATTINNALTTVKALKPYQFTWKHDSKLGQGFFAHEAQEVLPDIGVVSGTKDAVQTEDDIKTDGQWKKDDPIYQGIDYSKLVPLLTAALQEETAKREALEARVAALEGN